MRFFLAGLCVVLAIGAGGRIDPSTGAPVDPSSLFDQVQPGSLSEDSATIQIDCDAGDTLDDIALDLISAATTDGDDDDDDDDGANSPLVVEIAGTCTGNWVIRRDNVTLRGVGDEAVLRGALSEGQDPRASVVEARRVNDLVLENLTVENGYPAAVDAFHSTVSLTNVRLKNSDRGFRSQGSNNVLTDCSIESNRRGVSTAHGDLTHLRSTEVFANEIGLRSVGNGWIVFVDGVIRNNFTAFAVTSEAQITQAGFSEIRDNTNGGWALLGGTIRFGGSADAPGLKLRVGLQSSGSLEFLGSHLDIGDGKVSVDGGSSFLVVGGLTGNVQVSEFSKAIVTGFLDGELLCSDASDAVCPGNVTTSNCASCDANPARGLGPGSHDTTLPPEIRALLDDPGP